MKKSILLFIAVINSLLLFSQSKPYGEQLFTEPLQACSTPIISVQESNVPGFRRTTTGIFNELPVLTYKNSIVNNTYIDGIRHDVSVSKDITISDMEGVQFFNSIMKPNLYSLTSN